MLKTRLIPTVLFKDHSLVKSVQFANLRMLGNPIQTVKVYNARNVDELVFLDIGAPIDNHEPQYEVVSEISEDCFMPLTVGGGIKTVGQIRRLLKIGADKIALNTYAFKSPSLIRDAANKFGSQAIVVSIDVKRVNANRYEIFITGGKQATGIEVTKWAKEVARRGAGEILLTSIDHDGQMLGYDLQLIKAIAKAINIPIIASGGAGKPEHFVSAIKNGADAVAAASIFHYTQYTPQSIKNYMRRKGIPVRL